jgi:hypothetical protein
MGNSWVAFPSFFFQEEGAALTSLSDPPTPGLGFQAFPLREFETWMVESYQMNLDQTTGRRRIVSNLICDHWRESLYLAWDPEFRASSIEDRRKVLAMISFWDAVDSHQLIIEGLPRAEKIMISDRTEKDMAFPSEWFDMLIC